MNYKTRLIFCFVIFGAARVGLAFCTNSACTPGFKSGYDANLQHNVYLDPSLTQAELDAANNAIDAWGGAYGADGKTPPFCVVQNPSAADIVVRNDPSMSGTFNGGSYDTTTHEIDLNPDFGAKGGFLKQVMLMNSVTRSASPMSQAAAAMGRLLCTAI
jgi:hypothetical protein